VSISDSFLAQSKPSLTPSSTFSKEAVGKETKPKLEKKTTAARSRAGSQALMGKASKKEAGMFAWKVCRVYLLFYICIL
jgi:hypothetical protein